MKLFLKILREWTDPWRLYVAEFIGTFIFVFLTLCVAVVAKLYGTIEPLAVSMVSAMSYAALIFATVNISGGFLNPAITTSLWLVQKLSGVRATFYIISQICGGIAAVLLLFAIFGANLIEFNYGLPQMGIGVSFEMGLALEAIFTAVLIFVVFATMVDRRGPVSFGPLVLGVSTFAISIIAQPMTGAIFNPARVVGSSIVGGDYSRLAVYVIGPLVGSLFAFVYDIIFLKASRAKK